MRTMKFRGKVEGKWVYVRATDHYTSLEWDEFWKVADRDTVGQWTGLFDKNGAEVYEGDIVELVFLHPARGPYTQKAKVVWSGFRWWLEHLDIKPDGHLQADWLESRHQDNCEITGNIYDQS